MQRVPRLLSENSNVAQVVVGRRGGRQCKLTPSPTRESGSGRPSESLTYRAGQSSFPASFLILTPTCPRILQ